MAMGHVYTEDDGDASVAPLKLLTQKMYNVCGPTIVISTLSFVASSSKNE